MKRVFNYLLVIILFSFIFIMNANAECSYQERRDLLNDAKNIDISFDINEEEKVETGVNTYGEQVNITSKIYNIKINVSGLTDNVFIKYYNYFDNEEKYIHYSDTKNGVFIFEDDNYTDLYTYYFEMFSSKSGCLGNKLYTKKVVKPIYNGYSNYNICKNEGMDTFKYCQKFVTEDFNIIESEFIELANEYLNNMDVEEIEKDFNFVDILKNYYIYFLVVIVLIVTIIIVIIIKNKRSRL